MIKISRPPCPRPDRLASDYKYPENKEALIQASYGKCMYCEASVRDVSFGDIEHIKPKSRFAALEFQWENLGFVCSRCNNSKSDKYEELMPYIDPYTENPQDFLVASGSMILQKQGNSRGEITIRDIGLNRPDLVEKRLEALNHLQKSIDACFRTPEPLKTNLINELINEVGSDKEFSFVLRQRLALESL